MQAQDWVSTCVGAFSRPTAARYGAPVPPVKEANLRFLCLIKDNGVSAEGPGRTRWNSGGDRPLGPLAPPCRLVTVRVRYIFLNANSFHRIHIRAVHRSRPLLQYRESLPCRRYLDKFSAENSAVEFVEQQLSSRKAIRMCYTALPYHRL